MTMMIQKAILHILDFNTNICILSQQDLDFSSDVVYEYVDKRIERLLKDAGQQTGVFYATSSFQHVLQKLQMEEITFDDAAAAIAKKTYDILSHCDETESTDLLVVDFNDDDDVRTLAVLMLENKTAYTHQVLDEEGHVYNKLIKHYAILPGTGQKIEAYALIRFDDFSIRFVDKKRKRNGEDMYILPDRLLQCTSCISGRDAVKMVNKIAAQVAEDHGGSSVEALSKAKNYLADHAETSDSLSPKELGAVVFSDNKEMQNQFEQEIQEAQLPDQVPVQQDFARRTGKTHKIKTDTGIEITFPSEYIDNSDYIQFINNPDGTLSIELKNIAKIVNK